ncbi:MAG: hypothetical protein A2Z97_10310 [Bdellovibrionales bacterium GWB1_52_6]|nr:MAG: hypothetical protein A2Z97_10310 [Bdellovibrionales bacterium GWB1_52_6]OFZ03338.1 MAG: hypothetical protein A2X97_05185 [Bdellovibrionales bacterium GWA1_52_35]HCM40921.1 hypothetical protein [Bdellovibrionales bacterium]
MPKTKPSRLATIESLWMVSVLMFFLVTWPLLGHSHAFSAVQVYVFTMVSWAVCILMIFFMYRKRK